MLYHVRYIKSGLHIIRLHEFTQGYGDHVRRGPVKSQGL